MSDANRTEAERRVRAACRLIEGAFRLADLDPQGTVDSLKAAIIDGAQLAADDVREAVEKA